MDTVTTIISVFFIGLLIIAAVTFGFALLVFLISVAVVTAMLVYGQQLLLRWNFIRSATRAEQKPPANSPKVIDVEYEDISNK